MERWFLFLFVFFFVESENSKNESIHHFFSSFTVSLRLASSYWKPGTFGTYFYTSA